MVLDADHGAQRPGLNQFHFIGFIQIPMLLFEISVDVPRIPFLRFVVESLQQISASVGLGATSIGFWRRKRFRLSSQIDKTCDASGLWIDFYLDGGVFECRRGSLDELGVVLRCRGFRS